MKTERRAARRASTTAIALALAATGLAACARSSASTSSIVDPKTGCAVPADHQSVTAKKLSSAPNDYELTSFDGTSIRVHYFPLSEHVGHAASAPTVLMGPGWGEAGSTDTSSTGIFGSLSIGSLWAAGYNVVTWDPRGFGASKGTIEIDSAAIEGRDTSALISWVAQQKGVELDSAGDPRMGMVGASYGGGIQLVTAAQDCRIDAIAPTIAWHSLATSLAKNKAPKTGWSDILMAASSGRQLDPKIMAAYRESQQHGTASKESEDFFTSRGPGAAVSKVTVPTLILQGSVDDLFTLAEGTANYEALKKAGTTVAMVWFCGGHGSCLTNPGRSLDVGALSVAWMDRWVKRDKSAQVVKGFEFVDQDGVVYQAPSWPPTKGAPVVASGSGSLELAGDGGSGPAKADPSRSGASAVDAVALNATPAKAAKAVDVTIPFASAAKVVGAPSLSLTYRGSSPSSDRPGRVFAQLVDPSTGIVVNNQITPIPVTLDGKEHSITLPLEIVGFSAAAGSTLVLQITPTTVAYAHGALGGSIDLRRISVTLPTATDLTVAKG